MIAILYLTPYTITEKLSMFHRWLQSFEVKLASLHTHTLPLSENEANLDWAEKMTSVQKLRGPITISQASSLRRLKLAGPRIEQYLSNLSEFNVKISQNNHKY